MFVWCMLCVSVVFMCMHVVCMYAYMLCVRVCMCCVCMHACVCVQTGSSVHDAMMCMCCQVAVNLVKQSGREKVSMLENISTNSHHVCVRMCSWLVMRLRNI